jgi:protein-disulfide isomerase
MIVAALAVAAGAVRNTFFRPAVGSASSTSALIPLTDWNHAVLRARPQIDPAGKAVVLVFTDYQCPFCRKLESTLDSLTARRGTQAAVIYRHFPLPQHEFASRAAYAAECAGDGGGFLAMHKALFAAQDSLGKLSWSEVAARAGLASSASVDSCVSGGKKATVIRTDRTSGERLNLTGTPTLYIDGRLFTGRASLARLDSAVGYALSHPRMVVR